MGNVSPFWNTVMTVMDGDVASDWSNSPTEKSLRPSGQPYKASTLREDKTARHLTFPEASTNINSLILMVFWESQAIISKRDQG